MRPTPGPAGVASNQPPTAPVRAGGGRKPTPAVLASHPSGWEEDDEESNNDGGEPPALGGEPAQPRGAVRGRGRVQLPAAGRVRRPALEALHRRCCSPHRLPPTPTGGLPARPGWASCPLRHARAPSGAGSRLPQRGPGLGAKKNPPAGRRRAEHFLPPSLEARSVIIGGMSG